jgi:hypothetical protein
MGILDDWQVTWDDLNAVIGGNPSLRGMVFGYVAERKLQTLWFSGRRFSEVVKYRNHDRLEKGDLGVTYRRHRVRIEAKSLQTATVRQTPEGGYTAKFQCDASDRRKIAIVDVGTIETTCLMVGEFDLLAVNLFAFGLGWKFAFARNRDLPRSRFSKYTPAFQEKLLASTMTIIWPLQPPYEPEPFRLLDEIVQERISVKL